MAEENNNTGITIRQKIEVWNKNVEIEKLHRAQTKARIKLDDQALIKAIDGLDDKIKKEEELKKVQAKRHQAELKILNEKDPLIKKELKARFKESRFQEAKAKRDSAELAAAEKRQKILSNITQAATNPLAFAQKAIGGGVGLITKRIQKRKDDALRKEVNQEVDRDLLVDNVEETVRNVIDKPRQSSENLLGKPVTADVKKNEPEKALATATATADGVPGIITALDRIATTSLMIAQFSKSGNENTKSLLKRTKRKVWLGLRLAWWGIKTKFQEARNARLNKPVVDYRAKHIRLLEMLTGKKAELPEKEESFYTQMVNSGKRRFQALKNLVSGKKKDSRVSAFEEAKMESRSSAKAGVGDKLSMKKPGKPGKFGKLKAMNPMNSIKKVFSGLFRGFGKIGRFLLNIGSKLLIPLVTNPIGWGIILGTIAVGLLWTFKDKIAEVIGSVWEGIKSGVDKAISFITEFFSGIKDKVNSVIRSFLPDWASDILFSNEEEDAKNKEIANERMGGDQEARQKSQKDVYREMDAREKAAREKAAREKAAAGEAGGDDDSPEPKKRRLHRNEATAMEIYKTSRFGLKKWKKPWEELSTRQQQKFYTWAKAKKRKARKGRIAKATEGAKWNPSTANRVGGVVVGENGKSVDLSPEDQERFRVVNSMRDRMARANAMENNALNSIAPGGRGTQPQGTNNVVNAPQTTVHQTIHREHQAFNNDATIRALQFENRTDF